VTPPAADARGNGADPPSNIGRAPGFPGARPAWTDFPLDAPQLALRAQLPQPGTPSRLQHSAAGGRRDSQVVLERHDRVTAHF
jgi:hypothetical protein